MASETPTLDDFTIDKVSWHTETQGNTETREQRGLRTSEGIVSLSIQGNQFIHQGRPILLRGVGIANWLNLEHFLLGIPGTETEIRAAIHSAYGSERATLFWRTYQAKVIAEADLRFLIGLGMNCVRLPINARAMGLCAPKSESRHLRLVGQASGGWNSWDMFKQDSAQIVQGQNDKHAHYRAMAAAASRANRRFREGLSNIPFDQLLSSLEDWRFENCDVAEALLAVVRRR